ncbi:MAG TPA: FAD-dependent oxidoreductase, partial [Phycisphaerales bacterium]|nr:FAD-dependent oxidoreductase [Phycisphaerales bacterium]
MIEQYRKVSLCLSLFLTALIFLSASGLAGTVLVEAEGFDDTGGWVVDQQFMQVMGSPYLLAHGMGEPVADAVTTVTFPSTGTYKMWVRTKDWVPGAWTAPGRFQVLIDGTAVGGTFGTIAGWTWQDGGTINVTNTQVQIKLHDLTGFDGRCDAIYFDTNTSAVPVDFDVNNPHLNRQWRNGLLGLPDTPPDGGTFDVVIVGGGIAGCAAAMAAEKEGLTVALIQDRPLLGGNNSSEIRVHTEGIHGDGTAILSQIDGCCWANNSPDSIISQAKRTATMNAVTGVTIFR